MVSKSDTVPVKPASNDAFSELEQLRLLVFGQAKQQLDNRIDELNHRLRDDIEKQQNQFNKKLNEINAKLDEQHQTILSALADLGSVQEADKTELLQANNELISQLEMADNASRDESVLMHKRIDEEVSALESNLSKTTQDIVLQLEKVTKELSGSKTDRKKLALLLANVASNLDADD